MLIKPSSCFVLAVFIIVGFFANAAVSEQSSVETGDVPACLSNFGTDGELAEGYFAAVIAPVPFTTMTSSDGIIDVFGGSIRSHRAAVVFVSSRQITDVESITDLNERLVVKLDFFKDDRTVHSCTATIRIFDKRENRMEQLAFGDCGISQRAGLPELAAGHGQIFELPDDTYELAATPGQIIDATMISTRSISVRGVAEGVGQVLWLKGNNEIGGLCPFDVAGPHHHLNDDVLCRSIAMEPVRLAVGETVDIALFDVADNSRTGFLAGVIDESVATVDFVEVETGKRMMRIVGRAPGTTSIVRFERFGKNAAVCAVVITSG